MVIIICSCISLLVNTSSAVFTPRCMIDSFVFVCSRFGGFVACTRKPCLRDFRRRYWRGGSGTWIGIDKLSLRHDFGPKRQGHLPTIDCNWFSCLIEDMAHSFIVTFTSWRVNETQSIGTTTSNIGLITTKGKIPFVRFLLYGTIIGFIFRETSPIFETWKSRISHRLIEWLNIFVVWYRFRSLSRTSEISWRQGWCFLQVFLCKQSRNHANSKMIL